MGGWFCEMHFERTGSPSAQSREVRRPATGGHQYAWCDTCQAKPGVETADDGLAGPIDHIGPSCGLKPGNLISAPRAARDGLQLIRRQGLGGKRHLEQRGHGCTPVAARLLSESGTGSIGLLLASHATTACFANLTVRRPGRWRRGGSDAGRRCRSARTVCSLSLRRSARSRMVRTGGRSSTDRIFMSLVGASPPARRVYNSLNRSVVKRFVDVNQIMKSSLLLS